MSCRIPKRKTKRSQLKLLGANNRWCPFLNNYFGPDYENGNANDLLLSLRQMMARMIAYCPREDSNGWKLQKLHEQLHLVISLVFFNHAQNFDAGSGEWLLKDFLKKIGTNVPTASSGHFYSPSFLLSSNTGLMTLRKAAQECKPRIF
jgi:hypothetical protein